MVQTYTFKTETADKTYHQTIHSVDIKTAVDRWIRQIEDLQNQVYSFNSTQVQSIKQQYLDGKLKMHVDIEPFSLTFIMEEKFQVVNICKVNKGDPDFIAQVTYFTSEQGGRKGYATSGYRPHLKFPGRKELTSGEQLFIENDKVFPGESVKAEIRILGKEFFKEYLFVGQLFEISEGSHLVGRGEILEVINPGLRLACP